MDALELLKQIPDKSIDLVVTDPPYGMNFRSNRRKEKYDKIIGDDEFPMWIFDEFFRVSRKAVYIFCRWDNIYDLPKPKSLISWVKNNHSSGDLFHEHARKWEAICFYPMEEHKFIKRTPDVVNNKKTGNKFHPTQKPTDLIEHLIRSNEGQLILDPFMGSWTTAVSCQNLKRDFIGCELDKDYCEIGKRRLRQKTLF